MTNIITIFYSILTFLIGVATVFYSRSIYLHNNLKNSILKLFESIDSEYWQYVPDSNVSKDTIIENNIFYILLTQEIHSHGLGKYIIVWEGDKWYEKWSSEYFSNILDKLPIKELKIIKKYYKKINNRIKGINKKILTNLYFFESNKAYGIVNRNVINFLSNDNYIEFIEILLYFSYEKDANLLKNEPKNTRLEKISKDNNNFPFDPKLWAVKFKILNNNNMNIFAIFDFDKNQLSKIKLYNDLQNNYNIWLLQNDIDVLDSTSEECLFLKSIIDSDNILKAINDCLNKKQENSFFDKISNISKSYHYIYCAVNLTEKISNYSILKENQFLIDKTHFKEEEIDFAFNFLNSNKSKEYYINSGFSRNHLILIIWEAIASYKEEQNI